MKDMAIKSYDICDKKATIGSANSQKENDCSLAKHYATNSSTTSTASKIEKKRSKKHESGLSPYLVGDRVQLLSRVMEKKLVHKKTLDYKSSFPMAVNIYKANSDEFKTMKKTHKKNKKSVLTLPNEPALKTQVCTVSDMNDSEYYSRTNINPKPRLKKVAIKNVRKPRVKNKNDDFYDTDTEYRPQLHIHLNGSPTDIVTRYKSDNKTNYHHNKDFKPSHLPGKNEIKKDDMKPHDVWEMLRNINRFQYVPSPPMSDESTIVSKKKKAPKNRIKRKNTRFIETCRTEEIAYISSYNVDNSSRSLTQSSSFDRITVIDNKDEFSKRSKDIENRFIKIPFPKLNNNIHFESRDKVQKRRVKRRNVKNTCHPITKGKRTEVTLKQDFKDSKKVNNINSEDTQECNQVSSLLNIDDMQHIPFSEVTSVCSDTKKCELEYNSAPVNRIEMFSNNSSKIQISAESSRGGKTGDKKGEKKQDNDIEHFPVPNQIISKVISSNAKRCKASTNPVTLRGIEAQKRISTVVTTMPRKCILPKLTRTEIKRRLGSIRFPITVLTKEQVSSSIKLKNIDAPQFNGLDKHIWPFMMEWEEYAHIKKREEQNNVIIDRKFNNNYEYYCLDHKSNKLNKTPDGVKKKQSNYKEKINDTKTTTNKTEGGVVSPRSIPSQAQKPVAQFKDRMFNLLNKKVRGKTIDKNGNNEVKVSQPNNIKIKTEVCTRRQTKPALKSIEPNRVKKLENPIQFLNKKSVISLKRPWAKAKRASDFIENVIKNIKNGVYYCKDHKYINRIREVSMQTDPHSDQEDIHENDFSPKVTIKQKKTVATIPGFDSSLFGLEIKTLNMKQIAIKHCITNVMIQFDVTVPAEINKVSTSPKTSAAVVPVEVTESQTKIFKYKTSIINAKLPAELCSIIPRMMKVIDPSIQSLIHSCCTGIIDKTVSNLSTITEMSRKEVPNAELVKNFVSIIRYLSPIEKILEGMFTKTRKNISDDVIIFKLINNYEKNVNELLPKLFNHNTVVAIPTIIKSYLRTHLDDKKTLKVLRESLTSPSNTCTALDIYSTKNKRIIPAFKPYDFTDFIKSIFKSQTFCSNTRIQDGMKMCLYINIKMTIENMDYIPQFSEDINTSLRETHSKSKRSLKCLGENRQSDQLIKIANNKNKRKRFYKLYRKCKSASNIPSTANNINTPLNKIQTLEDFLAILGAKHILTGVFDGYAAKKILSSIAQIKNWITEINPRQALLILLLCNKKDTPNLIRYRPVLLQGIAVNRITRATELDMEIEVIERENLAKLPQYEGITYLPDSVENHDQLLEELYWIAKTTASDYQKPFDESSEKLLKSLLEKRKKLNPSYLRVMARYVGLGLLKTTFKK